jgi:lysophospholipase L1-like esterase
MRPANRLVLKLALAATSIAGVLAAGEVLLSMRARYSVWPPSLSIQFSPAPEAMPGVTGESHFVINEQGVRGRPFGDEKLRILAVGGSTTECLFLDDTEAWPYLVEQELQAALGQRSGDVWVGNVGKSGHTSDHHVLQVRHLLAQYPHVDIVIVLVGINDMLRVAHEGGYRPMTAEQLALTFWTSPGWEERDAVYKGTQIWRLVRRARDTLQRDFSGALVQNTGGTMHLRLRANRRAATGFRTTVPDLDTALVAFRRNLHELIDAAEQHNAAVVLMTQPYLWKEDLRPDLAEFLWTGRVGGQYGRDDRTEYYTIEALRAAQAAYNEALLEVCRERELACIDLAAALPQDETVFYDDAHFNESGARQVANVVVRSLLEFGVVGRQSGL